MKVLEMWTERNLNGTTNRRMSLAALAAVALISAASAVTGITELIPFLRGGGSSKEKFEHLLSGALTFGPSSYSKGIVLQDCQDMITSFYGRAQPPHRRMGILSNCRAEARQILRRNPSNSFGWFVAAAISAELGDWPAFNQEIGQSAATAPNEAWLASLRIELGRQAFAQLERNSADRLAGDILLVAQTFAGREWLARKYVAEPTFQPVIISALDDLSSDRKKAFLDAVKKALAAKLKA